MPDFTLSRTRAERAAEDRVLLPLEHDVERLQEGQAGLEQRGQLLAEEHAAGRSATCCAPDAAGP